MSSRSPAAESETLMETESPGPETPQSSRSRSGTEGTPTSRRRIIAAVRKTPGSGGSGSGSTSTSTSGGVTSRRGPTRPKSPLTTTTTTPRRTPKRSLEEENLMISSLLTGPIIHSPALPPPPPPADGLELTPGKENNGLGMGVKALTLNSPQGYGQGVPDSPVSSKQAPHNFKRPKQESNVLTPVNTKRVRQSSSFNELLTRPTKNNLLLGYLSEDETGFGSSEDEKSPIPSGPRVRNVLLTTQSPWNNSPSPLAAAGTGTAPRSAPALTGTGSPLLFQQRSQSESAVSAMNALDMSRADPLLIGDCSKRYVLPILDKGRHTDLKEISADTLVRLIDGHYRNEVSSFLILDCRYPYEYDGGHIRGAENLYTEREVFEKLMEKKSSLPVGSKSSERNILIFHCEFSQERGPRMCRNFRDWDRKCNYSSFPSLHYPEVYVLYGGYKSFFESHKAYCDPPTYTPMIDEKFGEQLRFCKNKSKTELMSKAKNNSSTASIKIARQLSLKTLCI